MKDGKALDMHGLTAEAFKNLPDETIHSLADMYDEHSCKHDLSSTNEDWIHVAAILMPKTPGTEHVADWRPIHLLAVMHKTYPKCLYLLLKMHVVMTGFIQFGARQHHQCAEVVHV